MIRRGHHGLGLLDRHDSFLDGRHRCILHGDGYHGENRAWNGLFIDWNVLCCRATHDQINTRNQLEILGIS